MSEKENNMEETKTVKDPLEVKVPPEITDKRAIYEFTMKEKTAYNKERLLYYLREGLGIVTYACSKTPVALPTYYHYYKKDPAFQEQVDLIRNELQPRIVEDKLLKMIDENNVTAVIFYLKSRHKDYKPKLGLEGEIGIYNPYDKLTTEQLKKRIGELIGQLGEEDREELPELGE